MGKARSACQFLGTNPLYMYVYGRVCWAPLRLRPEVNMLKWKYTAYAVCRTAKLTFLANGAAIQPSCQCLWRSELAFR